MTRQDPRNNMSIAGSAHGAETREEGGQRDIVNIPLAGTRSLKKLGREIVSSIDYRLSTLDNSQTAPKYATSTNFNYYAGGTFSVDVNNGGFIFGKNVNERYNGIFRLSDKDSKMYSQAANTTIGKTEIKTVDGYQTNPAGTILPSTNFTPSKTWLKQLIPDVPFELLAKITILELVQAALFSLIRNSDGTNTEIDGTAVDLGTIVIDREDEFL